MKPKLILYILFLLIFSNLFSQTRLSDEEIAKRLENCKCLNATKGTEGLELIRQSLLKEVAYGQNPVQRFCLDLRSVDGLRRFPETQPEQFSYKSSAVNHFRDAVVEACHLEVEDKQENRRRYLLYYNYLNNSKSENHSNALDKLVKMIPILLPKTCSCDDRDSSYTEGHLYLSILDRELYELLDFFILDSNEEYEKEFGVKLEEVLNQRERAYLKEKLCLKIKNGGGDITKNAIKYFARFFPDEKCSY